MSTGNDNRALLEQAFQAEFQKQQILLSDLQNKNTLTDKEKIALEQAEQFCEKFTDVKKVKDLCAFLDTYGFSDINQLVANDKGDQNTPLIRAIKDGRKDIFSMLLAHPKIDVNKADINNRSPVWWAAAGGTLRQTEVDQNALAYLKELEQKKADLTKADKQEKTPLGIAIQNKIYNAAAYIVDKITGYKIYDVGEFKQNPVHVLCSQLSEKDPQNTEKVLHFFINENKVDINSRNDLNQTPLLVAAQAGNLVAVEWLIKNGADVTVVDKRGLTFLEYARENQKEVSEILKRNGLNEKWYEDVEKVKEFGHVLGIGSFLKLGHKLGLGGIVNVPLGKGQTTAVFTESWERDKALTALDKLVNKYQNQLKEDDALKFSKLSKALGLAAEGDLEKMHNAYNAGEPVIIPLGVPGHTVGLAIYKDKLIFTDRFKMYPSNDKCTKVFELDSKKAREVIEQLQGQHDSVPAIIEKLNKHIDFSKPIVQLGDKPQAHATCAFSNPRSNLEGLLCCMYADKNPTAADSKISKEAVLNSQSLAHFTYRKFLYASKNFAIAELVEKINVAEQQGDHAKAQMYYDVAKGYMKGHKNKVKREGSHWNNTVELYKGLPQRLKDKFDKQERLLSFEIKQSQQMKEKSLVKAASDGISKSARNLRNILLPNRRTKPKKEDVIPVAKTITHETAKDAVTPSAKILEASQKPLTVEELGKIAAERFKNGDMQVKKWVEKGVVFDAEKWKLAVAQGGRQKGWVEKTFGIPENEIIEKLKGQPAPKTQSLEDIQKAYGQANPGNATRDVPSFTIVEGVGVNDLHHAALGQNCILQVASQFNFQESPSSQNMPVSSYLNDYTQGPQASIEAAAAALLRKAAYEAGTLPDALNNVLPKALLENPPLNKYGNLYTNGYLDLGSKREIIGSDPKRFEHVSEDDKKLILQAIQNNLKQLLVLPQEVTCEASGAKQLQVFCAAPQLAGGNADDPINKAICKELVVAQYVAIAQLAVIESRKTGKIVPLHLTLVGQGAFANDKSIMKDALEAVAKVVKAENVEVYLHAYNMKDKALIESQIKDSTALTTTTMSREVFKTELHPGERSEFFLAARGLDKLKDYKTISILLDDLQSEYKQHVGERLKQEEIPFMQKFIDNAIMQAQAKGDLNLSAKLAIQRTEFNKMIVNAQKAASIQEPTKTTPQNTTEQTKSPEGPSHFVALLHELAKAPMDQRKQNEISKLMTLATFHLEEKAFSRPEWVPKDNEHVMVHDLLEKTKSLVENSNGPVAAKAFINKQIENYKGKIPDPRQNDVAKEIDEKAIKALVDHHPKALNNLDEAIRHMHENKASPFLQKSANKTAEESAKEPEKPTVQNTRLK